MEKTDRQKVNWMIYKSPLRLLLIVAFSIFIAEAIVMAIINTIEISELAETFLDPLILVFLLSPLLFFFFFRPLLLHISERKRIEEELKAERDRLEQVTQNIGAGLAIISKDYRILWANEIVKQTFGNVAGKHCYMTYKKRTEVCANCGVREVFETGKDKVVREQKGFDIDGKAVWAEIVATPVKDKNGKIVAALELALPITELKKTEEALRESQKHLQFLSSQLLTIQEQERIRISRELHDELGQALTLLKLRVRFIEKELPGDHIMLREECENVLAYIDQTIENVRRISRDLSPMILEDCGLSTALCQMAKKFIEHYNVELSLDIGDIDHLFPQKAHIIVYRIFQEALTNVGRHSGATSVHAILKEKNGRFVFLVQDNGMGFNHGEVAIGGHRIKGLGLATMKERVRMLGGSLELWSQEGKGTRISFSVPIKKEEVYRELLSHYSRR